jgi:hypothetical protein
MLHWLWIAIFWGLPGHGWPEAPPCTSKAVFEAYKGECREYKNDDLCVEVEVGEQRDDAGTPLVHLWDFGDGQVHTGFKQVYCYETFGHYPILLITQRYVQGTLLADTTHFVADIDHVVMIQEISAENREKGRQLYFDGTNSFITKDFVIKEFYWSYGDDAFGCGMLSTHLYQKPGNYLVRLIAEGEDQKGRKKRVCGSKWIQIPD